MAGGRSSAPRAAGSRTPRASVAAAVAVAVVAAVILVARMPAAAYDVGWAEDARNFLGDAAAGDANPLRPAAGYLHLVPRLVALVVVETVPVTSWAIAATIASLGLVAAASGATWLLARPIVAWQPARLGIALVPAVVPQLGVETLGNLANLHTTCLWLAMWILLSPPRRGARRIGWAVVALACLLTEVQGLLLVPLAIGALVVHRRAAIPTAGATLVGAAAQATSMVLSPRGGYPDIGLGVPDVVVGWLVQAVLPLATTDVDAIRGALAAQGAAVGVLAALPLVAAGVVAVLRGTTRQRVTAVVLALVSASIMGGCILTSQLEVWRYASIEGEAWRGAIVLFRYGAAAALPLVALVLLAASVIVELATGRRRAPVRLVGALVVAALLAWLLVQGAAVSGSRADGPRWSTGVEAAADACAQGVEDADVPLAPTGWGDATLPCDVLVP